MFSSDDNGHEPNSHDLIKFMMHLRSVQADPGGECQQTADSRRRLKSRNPVWKMVIIMQFDDCIGIASGDIEYRGSGEPLSAEIESHGIKLSGYSLGNRSAK